jgi:hypothetical protein
MSRPTRLAGGIVVTRLAISSSWTLMAEGRNGGERPVALVRVDNLAGITAGNVRVAEERAAAIFGLTGATIRWIDQEQAVRERVTAPFTIVLANAEKNPVGASLFVDALGVAYPSVHRAQVLYDRVADLNVGTLRTIPSLLGDVIAHELGHLLLPPPGHSPTGIMRAELETRSWGLRTFTSLQAREVLSRLRALPPLALLPASGLRSSRSGLP